jgi:hypothetical protein
LATLGRAATLRIDAFRIHPQTNLFIKTPSQGGRSRAFRHREISISSIQRTAISLQPHIHVRWAFLDWRQLLPKRVGVKSDEQRMIAVRRLPARTVLSARVPGTGSHPLAEFAKPERPGAGIALLLSCGLAQPVVARGAEPRGNIGLAVASSGS